MTWWHIPFGLLLTLLACQTPGRAAAQVGPVAAEEPVELIQSSPASNGTTDHQLHFTSASPPTRSASRLFSAEPAVAPPVTSWAASPVLPPIQGPVAVPCSPRLHLLHCTWRN